MEEDNVSIDSEKTVAIEDITVNSLSDNSVGDIVGFI